MPCRKNGITDGFKWYLRLSFLDEITYGSISNTDDNNKRKSDLSLPIITN